jgi:hypothetical protein
VSLKPVTIDEAVRYFKTVIYGPQGEGKTRWTAENLPRPIAWFDFERSTDTLQDLEDKSGIEIFPIKPDGNPDEILAFVRELKKPTNKYKSIVFDTISTAQIFQINKWMEKQSHDLPLFQDYRMSTHIFNKIFFELQHTDIHVVLIAHEREIWEGEPPNRRKIAVGPAITPALHDSVTQLVSGVFRLQKTPSMRAGVKPTWAMISNKKDKFVAKNRYGITDTVIENPTWNTFMKGNVND